MQLTVPYDKLFAEGGICVMPPLRRKRLLDEILSLQFNDDSRDIYPGDTMVCLVAHFLFEICLFSDEQVWLILRKAKPVLACIGRDLNTQLQHVRAIKQTWLIAVADRKYVSWSVATGWLCLETGDWLAEIPEPPLETISFHLSQIATRMLKQL